MFDALEITGTLTGRNGMMTLVAKVGDESLTDRVNITRMKDREQFASQVVKKWPTIKMADVTAELERQAAQEADRPEPAAAKSVENPAVDSGQLLAAMPQDIRAEAEAMLLDPDLVKQILVDLTALGVAGENELKLSLYIIFTSRLLARPLAAIVQGPSSSGKSYPISKVASLMPPEAMIRATTITPQALYYMKPGELKHKAVAAGERSRIQDDVAAEATRALREMISEGRLDKLVTLKGEDGKMQTQTIRQDGPIAYVESTTITKVFDEDSNRCLLFQTDERVEQTRRVLRQVATDFDGTRIKDDGRITQKHHALQRMLKGHDIVIPYAERLAELFPAERVEARRALGHLMAMISAVTLLHQKQRTTDDQGRLVAAAEDYELAKHLLDKPMGKLLGHCVSDAALRFLDRLRTRVNESPFTTTDAKKGDHASDRAVRGWLSELADAGQVELVELGKGPKPHTWRLTDDRPEESTAALPSVEMVLAKTCFRLSDKAQPTAEQAVKSATGNLSANFRQGQDVQSEPSRQTSLLPT